MRRFTFSVDKLKLMCSGQQPQKFEQIVFILLINLDIFRYCIKKRRLNKTKIKRNKFIIFQTLLFDT